jgi:large subunit ribosomal protein L7/L12
MFSSRRIAVVLTLAALCAAGSSRSDTPARYSVVIVTYDAQWKIRGIKAIREETGLGLAEAKRLIESSPGLVKSRLSKADAEALAARLGKERVTAEVRKE